MRGAGGLRRLLTRFWPYLRKERGLLWGGFAALVLQVGLRLLEPWPLKLILDHVIVANPESTGFAALDDLTPETLLLVVVLALVGVVALRAAAGFVSTVGFALVSSRVLSTVREELFRHLQRLPLSYHTKTQGGDLTVRLVADVGLLKDVAVTAALPLVVNAFVLAGMLSVMLWLDAGLALIAVAALPLCWLVSRRGTRRLRAAVGRQRRSEGALAGTAAETLGAIRVVQALSLEPFFRSTFERDNREGLRAGVRAKRLEAGLERSTDVLIAAATALVLYFGARLVLAGSLTPGELVVFANYLKNTFKPVHDLAKYTARLAKAGAAGERVLDVLETVPAIGDRPEARAAPTLAGALRFEDVHFAYEPGREVLRGVSLTVRPGERVAVVGPSGGGKSTLASLVPRLYDPDRGRVTVGGRDLRGFTLSSLRAQISLVPQENLLFGASVRGNIACGVPGATDAEVEAAARLAGAHDFVTHLPGGYGATVGERGATLSGGQRQRLAIARAALRRTPILILDEPTVGLDEENERLVKEALERLAEGRTTLLITHDLAFAARCDRVAYTEGGRVLEQGTHAELLEQNGRYAALYRLQVGAGAPPLPAAAGARFVGA